MQKIVPNLWCDHNAKQAADFYVSTFPDGKINATSYYPDSSEEGLADFQADLAGKELTVDFELAGYRFIVINADRTFTPNPSISFFFTCNSKEETDALWAKLSDSGKALMPLDKYPFSEYYGWVKDKFGFSWQLILNNPAGDWRPKIVPSLMFAQENVNKAEQAINFYTSIFHDAKSGNLARYEKATGPAKKGSLAYGDFQLEGEWFAAMDSGVDQDFTFSEAISLMVNCQTQAEIDDLWTKLSAVPESEQCGWLKDKYGVSWQITPANMDELMKTPGAFARMMKMHKLDIAGLQSE